MNDAIFASPMARMVDFDFDDRVADVFDDMLARSVPFYDEVQCMITEIIAQLVGEEPVIYDLGCSTGTTLLLLAKKLAGKDPRLIGLDSSEAMLRQAQLKHEKAGLAGVVTWMSHDLNQAIAIEPADAVIMNLTLQFIRPPLRDGLVSSIHRRLKSGGCFIMVEKVLADNPILNRTHIELYHRFKKRKGYSEMEIAQKREALENVLIPYRVSENIELLKKCGFRDADVFFRWYNFAGFIGLRR